MPRRRVMKGIADGLLGTFVSRNNDMHGYWGLGVLRRYSEKKKGSEIIIDLLDPKLPFFSRSPVLNAKTKYGLWLRDSLTKAGLAPSRVKQAQIKLRFSNYAEFPHIPRDTYGEPYECTVTITDDRGAMYQATKLGCCASHDPKRESRSTRVS